MIVSGKNTQSPFHILTDGEIPLPFCSQSSQLFVDGLFKQTSRVKLAKCRSSRTGERGERGDTREQDMDMTNRGSVVVCCHAVHSSQEM